MRVFRPLVAVPVLLGLVLAADPIWAAGKSTGAKLLTRDELRACLKQDKSNKARGEEAVKMQADLDQTKADIAREDAAIKADAAAVNAADEAAVNALKARAQALDEKIDGYNQGLPKFNDFVRALEADRADYKTRCADRKYDEKDLFAIQRGK